MPSQRQMIAEYPALTKRAELLDLAVHDLLTGQVTWSGWHGDPNGGKYRVGLFRANTTPSVIVMFRYPGQPDQTDVHDLDAYEQLTRVRRQHVESWQLVLDAIADARRKKELKP